MSTSVTTARRAGIRWDQWGPEVFERARNEDKLILLDSGATWCHWCHVMDHQTYDDPEVIALVNARFVPVRIDRDQLADVDGHFQRGPAIVQSHAGGWPLTVIVTPEGYTLFKATFVPPHSNSLYGEGTGLIELLKKLDEYWRQNRSQIATAGRQLQDAMARQEPPAASAGQPARSHIGAILKTIGAEYDQSHGGFGQRPKFFCTIALELLLGEAWAGRRESQEMLTRTLEAMARGGVYDQVGGGFHRYSVDERWHVPHFEKMAADNAALLAIYANAYALTGREEFEQVACQSLSWIQRTLSDPRQRGFYASQDADVGPGDDGDYFTWTISQFRDALGKDADTLIYYYDVTPRGDMHERPGRNVLHTLKTIHQMAALTNRDEAELNKIIATGKQKLMAERDRRPAPSVDETIFADINGMMIDAMLTVWERLGLIEACQQAIAVLDALMDDLRDGRGVFAHFRQAGRLVGIGMLSDQAWMMKALLHAFAVTTDKRYLEAACTLGDYIMANLTDKYGSPLSAPLPSPDDPSALPPVRQWEDSPARSPASVAAACMIDLGHLSGRDEYRAAGAKALASYVGSLRPEWGTFIGGWALSVDNLLDGPRSVVVVGSAERAPLSKAARAAYIPNGLVLEIDPSQAGQMELLTHMGIMPGKAPAAYLCRGRSCLQPVRSVNELRDRIREMATPGA